MKGKSLLCGRALAVLAVFSLSGCLSKQAPLSSAQRAPVADEEKVLCLDDYVKSIWKGEDLGGPGCADHAAYDGARGRGVHDRIESVCEHAEIRTILSGEAATRFTREACARHAHAYEPATIARACRTASRTSKARDEELNSTQSAACERYLHEAPPRSIAGESAEPAAPLSAPRESTLASAGRTSAREELAELLRFFRKARQGSEGQRSLERGAVAGAGNIPGSASAGVAAVGVCEDRFIESIWKGRDLIGAECAGYIDADGSAPRYRRARIQNVCDGAAIRAMRSGEPLNPFTLSACAGALRDRPPEPEAPASAREVAAAGATAEPSDSSARGLAEDEIAQTVDANWRSIGRDCLSVAPSSEALPEPANTKVIVTVTVGASGQVRDASAQAGGRRELESCIADSVRGWRFPAASTDTVVSIPLLFAGR